MVVEDKINNPLEGGSYIIQSVDSNTALNLAVREFGEDPYVCIWKSTRSATQLWHVEPTERGYLFRNPSTNKYISYAHGTPERDNVSILGLQRPVEWRVEKIDDYFVVKLASNPKFSLDVAGLGKFDSNRIILWGFHGEINQRWRFQRVNEEFEQPPSYSGQTYLGTVPVGIYWLGQPYEGGDKERSKKGLSKAALTAAAARPLKGNISTSAHLSVMGVDGPCPNQIWAVEPGLRGYRLKNMGTQSYLNCVDRVPIVESALQGLAGVTEWTFRRDPAHHWSDIPAFWIRPSFDRDTALGIGKYDMLNSARLKSLNDSKTEFDDKWDYTQWRFEAVEECFLDQL